MTQIRFVFKIFSLTVNVLKLTEGILLQLLSLGPQHRGHGGVGGAWKYEDFYELFSENERKMRVLREPIEAINWRSRPKRSIPTSVISLNGFLGVNLMVSFFLFNHSLR